MNLRCPNPSSLLRALAASYQVLAKGGRDIPLERQPAGQGSKAGVAFCRVQAKGMLGNGFGLKNRARNPLEKVQGSQGQGQW